LLKLYGMSRAYIKSFPVKDSLVPHLAYHSMVILGMVARLASRHKIRNSSSASARCAGNRQFGLCRRSQQEHDKQQTSSARPTALATTAGDFRSGYEHA